MSEEAKVSASEQKKEDWMNSKWRPMMGWMYMLVCTMDFVGFPVLWSLLQAMSKGAVNVQWQPLTLQGAGLFHIAMGAVLGLAAYGRTQEKLGGANNGGLSLGAGTTYTPPAPVAGSGFGGSGNATPNTPSGATAFGAAAAGNLGIPGGGFGSPAPVTNSWGSQPLAGGGGFGSPSSAEVSTTASGKKIVPGFDQPLI
jgi:hypothetical protein